MSSRSSSSRISCLLGLDPVRRLLYSLGWRFGDGGKGISTGPGGVTGFFAYEATPWLDGTCLQCATIIPSNCRMVCANLASTSSAEGRLSGARAIMSRTTVSMGSTALKARPFRFLESAVNSVSQDVTCGRLVTRWNEASATPPPRPGVRFLALRWFANDEILRSHKNVKMSVMTAPKEKMSDSCALTCWDCQVRTRAVLCGTKGILAALSGAVTGRVRESDARFEEWMDGV